jgi:hypothetical protein
LRVCAAENNIMFLSCGRFRKCAKNAQISVPTSVARLLRIILENRQEYGANPTTRMVMKFDARSTDFVIGISLALFLLVGPVLLTSTFIIMDISAADGRARAMITNSCTLSPPR